MIPKKLQGLIDFAKATDLQEVMWEDKDMTIRFERQATPLPAPANSPAAQAEQQAAAAALAAEAPVQPKGPEIIKSTMVGTFYRADSPNRPPLVVEGTVVSSGQPVASIEAMKIMKDVVAPHDCKIIKALVANGHAVEYGQPLFEVELVSEEPRV